MQTIHTEREMINNNDNHRRKKNQKVFNLSDLLFYHLNFSYPIIHFYYSVSRTSFSVYRTRHFSYFVCLLFIIHPSSAQLTVAWCSVHVCIQWNLCLCVYSILTTLVQNEQNRQTIPTLRPIHSSFGSFDEPNFNDIIKYPILYEIWKKTVLALSIKIIIFIQIKLIIYEYCHQVNDIIY